jgi:hypothetical protein
VFSMLKWITTIFFLFFTYLPLYAFDSEIGPGEGKKSFFAKTNITLPLHEEPSRSSPVIKKHEIGKGARIDYDLTRYRNIKPGIVKTDQSVTLSGRNFNAISYLSRSEYYSGNIPYKDYAFREGTSFEYLQYRAEGSCFIRWNNEVYDIDYCPWLDMEDTQFTVESEPVNEWWIRVTKGHTDLGWLLIDKSTVDEKRSF